MPSTKLAARPDWANVAQSIGSFVAPSTKVLRLSRLGPRLEVDIATDVLLDSSTGPWHDSVAIFGVTDDLIVFDSDLSGDALYSSPAVPPRFWRLQWGESEAFGVFYKTDSPTLFFDCPYAWPRRAAARAALTQVLAQLESSVESEANWDSYGGLPTSPGAFTGARQLLVTVAASVAHSADQIEPFEIAPMADGGILLGWRSVADEVEVRISPEGRYDVLFIRQRGAERSYEERHGVTLQSAVESVSKVLGGAASKQ